MIDLSTLLNTRSAYEQEFKSRGIDFELIEERFNDRDLLASGHVFVAISGNRRLQISLTKDDVPCAFLKTTGVNDEIDLLQIVVAEDNLMLEQCSELFSSWIMSGSCSKATAELASQFR